ncbi:unnamed protein product [[Candida] boidinii]|nr:unnamed protein product [[Candida] boidinii]
MESEYLTNIINYKPKFYNDSKISIWHKLPVYRRSAVLILLFLGKSGELRVVLTKRSKKLRSFSGHISLPGGKSDSGLESEWQVARREAEEEIGINRHNDFLKENFDFEIEKINLLPSYLSRTFLAVSPVIGFINWSSKRLSKIEEQHISNIILNPGESSSIFSVPLKDFLQPKPKKYELKECLKQSYTKTNWAGITWKLRSFIFPLHNDQEVKWLDDVQDLSSEDEETQTDMEFGEKTRNVWGLTANILHDLAEITYRGESYYSNSIYGEEDLMYSLINKGNQMKTKIRSDFEKSIINNSKGFKFQDVLGPDEINNLNKIYNRI